MALPTGTTWDARAHTLAKIEIVQRYLGAWFPIQGSYHGRIFYMDGFAGPGEYKGGHDGSPVAALATATEHKYAHVFAQAELLFLFVEQDAKRAAHLRKVLETRFPNLPDRIKWDVECNSFEPVMDDILSSIEATKQSIAPTFLFLDPFGWSGVSMKTIGRLLSFPRTEILLTFMINSTNHWLSHPDQERNFNQLFGSDSWNVITSSHGPGRIDAVLKCFVDGLRTVGCATYVLPFGMVSQRDKTEYYLIHGSNDPTLTALAKMKGAMWKVDGSGEFRFQDRLAGQTKLWGGEPDYRDLRQLLLTKFAGKTVTWDEIRRYVLLDTRYLDTHFNRNGLSVLEKSGAVAVTVLPNLHGDKRNRYTYPTRLHPFLKFHFPKSC